MLTLKPHSIAWSVAGASIPAVTFIAPAGLTARELAHMLDSLVRVSRRAEWHHFVSATVPSAGSARGIRFPEELLTCPWSSPRAGAAADTQGKRHEAPRVSAGSLT